jgi:hypothetical protein
VYQFGSVRRIAGSACVNSDGARRFASVADVPSNAWSAVKVHTPPFGGTSSSLNRLFAAAPNFRVWLPPLVSESEKSSRTSFAHWRT